MNLVTLSLFAVAVFITTSSLAYCALPPFYETLREFKALIEDPQFEKSFTSGEAIEKIERSEGGFLVTTNHRTVHVRIEYLQQEHPGPSKFKLIFNE